MNIETARAVLLSFGGDEGSYYHVRFARAATRLSESMTAEQVMAMAAAFAGVPVERISDDPGSAAWHDAERLRGHIKVEMTLDEAVVALGDYAGVPVDFVQGEIARLSAPA